jgi:hypothetical protein
MDIKTGNGLPIQVMHLLRAAQMMGCGIGT